MATYVDVFVPRGLDARPVEVYGGVAITLGELGDGRRPAATLHFGDHGSADSRLAAARQLDSLAAAVLTARQLLGIVDTEPAEPHLDSPEGRAAGIPAELLAEPVTGVADGLLRAAFLAEQVSPDPSRQSRWCVDLDPADRFAWAVFQDGVAAPVSSGLTITQATELVERLAGESWADRRPQDQAHPVTAAALTRALEAGQLVGRGGDWTTGAWGPGAAPELAQGEREARDELAAVGLALEPGDDDDDDPDDVIPESELRVLDGNR